MVILVTKVTWVTAVVIPRPGNNSKKPYYSQVTIVTVYYLQVTLVTMVPLVTILFTMVTLVTVLFTMVTLVTMLFTGTLAPTPWPPSCLIVPCIMSR